MRLHNPGNPRRAVLGGAIWQRCQVHRAHNAIHHAPNAATVKRIGAELRAVWNVASLAKAETALAGLVATYHDTAPKLAAWLQESFPKSLAVFALPSHAATPHLRHFYSARRVTVQLGCNSCDV